MVAKIFLFLQIGSFSCKLSESSFLKNHTTIAEDLDLRKQTDGHKKVDIKFDIPFPYEVIAY